MADHASTRQHGPATAPSADAILEPNLRQDVDASRDAAQQRRTLALFVMVVFVLCFVLVVGSALEVILYYFVLWGETPAIGRSAVFAISHTQFSPKLMGAISGLITLGLAVLARPSRNNVRWSILVFGSMLALAACLFLIVVYTVDENGAIGDMVNVGIGRDLSDAGIEELRKSVQAFYSAMAIWFVGLLAPLLTAPDKASAAKKAS